MNAQHRINQLARENRIDVFIDVHRGLILAVARQPARADHAREPFFLHQEAGLIRENAAESVMLMVRANHHVGAVERRALGVVIEERTASREYVPRIVDMKIEDLRSRNVKWTSATACGVFVHGHELSLRENLPMASNSSNVYGFSVGYTLRQISIMAS